MANTKTNVKQTNETKKEFVLGKKNYLILGIGFLIIIIGYILLSGGETSDRTIYNPEIYNFRRITLAPIVIFLGFITEIFGVMWKPKQKTLTE